MEIQTQYIIHKYIRINSSCCILIGVGISLPWARRNGMCLLPHTPNLTWPDLTWPDLTWPGLKIHDMGLRKIPTNGISNSDQWAFGPMGLRNNGASPYIYIHVYIYTNMYIISLCDNSQTYRCYIYILSFPHVYIVKTTYPLCVDIANI